MTLPLDPPVRLELPAEDPEALADLAAAVTGGAFHLGLLADHLAGPAVAVRDWVGRDAAAATAQVRVLTGLVRDERAAVTAAAARLEAHAGAVREAVARIRALRVEQREEFAAAVRRVAGLGGDPLAVAPTPPGAITAVVEEWRAAERGRVAQHAVLLAELADDAAGTARELAGSTAALGGSGGPGDDGRVLRHLAGLLPGWGDAELAGRGRALAAALDGPVTSGQLDELARGAAGWAALPPFADALLSRLGVDRLRWLLAVAGDDARAGSGPVAGLLAEAFGAAHASAVTTARYVAADDPDGAADGVVLGMAAVAAAALRAPGGGPSAAVLGSWGAQVLARERAQRATAQERVPRAEGSGVDPVGLLVRLLVRSGDAGAAARLLAGPGAYAALLARTWPPGAPELGALAHLAASAAGAEGAAAARAGLLALGEGLGPADAGTWTVRRATAAAVAPALTRALTAHPDVLTDLLGRAGGAAALPAADDAALRGLGCLTWDAAATGALGRALAAQVTGAADLPAAALGAFVAVQQYGQRLDHALAAAAAQAGAVDHAVWFDVLLSPLRGLEQVGRVDTLVQLPLDLAIGTVGHLVGADGSWSVGGDRGAVFTRTDAAARVLDAAGARAGSPVGAVAAAAFDGTLRRLGLPTGPIPPGWTWLGMVAGVLPDSVELGEVKARQFGHVVHR